MAAASSAYLDARYIASGSSSGMSPRRSLSFQAIASISAAMQSDRADGKRMASAEVAKFILLRLVLRHRGSIGSCRETDTLACSSHLASRGISLHLALTTLGRSPKLVPA